MNHITDNHDALLDYLYEEGDPAERLTIAKHLQECAACAVAVLEFQNVRGMLSDWTPPASQLGFESRMPSTSPSATIADHRVRVGPRDNSRKSRGWGPAATRWQCFRLRPPSCYSCRAWRSRSSTWITGWRADSRRHVRSAGDAADVPRHVDHAASREPRVSSALNRRELRVAVIRHRLRRERCCSACAR